MTLLEILAAHQKVGTGMTCETPDRCKCGALVDPDWPPVTEQYDGREVRDKAFALHQLRQIGEHLT